MVKSRNRYQGSTALSPWFKFSSAPCPFLRIFQNPPYPPYSRLFLPESLHPSSSLPFYWNVSVVTVCIFTNAQVQVCGLTGAVSKLKEWKCLFNMQHTSCTLLSFSLCIGEEVTSDCIEVFWLFMIWKMGLNGHHKGQKFHILGFLLSQISSRNDNNNHNEMKDSIFDVYLNLVRKSRSENPNGSCWMHFECVNSYTQRGSKQCGCIEWECHHSDLMNFFKILRPFLRRLAAGKIKNLHFLHIKM